MKITVVIVTYNGMKWIDECFHSLFASSIPLTIIAVDNGSNDGSVEHLKQNYKEIILLEQKVNLGFGQANNIGISYAIKDKADYVFLLNQDAFVEKNTLKELVDVAFRNPKYGILSPMQLDYSGNLLEDYFYEFITNVQSRLFFSDLVLKNELKEIYNIKFVQAAAWLLPVNTINKIGGFDPIFFHYGEDNNYCQRVLFHNLKIGIVPVAFVRHDSTKSADYTIKLFSERYFKNYLKNINVKYADINYNFTDNCIAIEKNKLYKLILISLLKLNFINFKGYIKKLLLFKNNIASIQRSRAKNFQLSSNYLNI